MTLQAISTSYSISSPSAARLQQENSDQQFATLLQADAKTKTGTPLTPSSTPASANPPATQSTSVATKEKTPAEQFLEYMHKSPQERWQEAWLKQHGYTKEQFDELSAEKKQALMDQMARDLKEQMRQASEKKQTDPSAI